MSDTDRFGDLQEYAKVTRGDAQSAVPAEIFPPASNDRVFGAQQVAVRRDIANVITSLKALAAAAGEQWYYRYPVKAKVKDEKTGKEEWITQYIEGPSIKLANDLWRMYGNCDVDTRVVENATSFLFYARFQDIESGASMTRAYRQRKSQKSINTGDGGRAEDIAFQIGQSKAIRNVIVNALQTYSTLAFEEARESLVKKIGQNIGQWRVKVAERFQTRGVDIKRVELVVGRLNTEWLASDVAKVIAMMKAVEDGMATLDETFPPIGGTAVTQGAAGGEVDQQAAQNQNLEERMQDFIGPDEQVDTSTGEITRTTPATAGGAPANKAKAAKAAPAAENGAPAAKTEPAKAKAQPTTTAGATVAKKAGDAVPDTPPDEQRRKDAERLKQMDLVNEGWEVAERGSEALRRWLDQFTGDRAPPKLFGAAVIGRWNQAADAADKRQGSIDNGGDAQ